MKRYLIAIGLCLCLLPAFSSYGQVKKKKWTDAINPSGYAQAFGMEWVPPLDQDWKGMQTEQFRLNLEVTPWKGLDLNVGARNLLYFGSLPQAFYPEFQDAISRDYGLMDLTWIYGKSKNYLFYTTLDRAYAEYSYKNWVFSAGRQRINWSVNTVWSPNDIFNTFNYFDFDYIERPGSDAASVTYYTGPTSSLHLAAKLDYRGVPTIAMMYRFNKWSYDFQFIAGQLPDDYVVGLGWSGQIGSAGFNGELSYLINRKDGFDDDTQLLASIGANYTFGNQLYVHAAGLLNTAGTTGPAGRGSFFLMNQNLSIKDLSPAKYSLFAETSYPITPLINLGLAGVWNPSDLSLYYSPSATFSLSTNVDLLLTAQLLSGDSGSEFGDSGQFYFMRVKWSF